MKEGGGGGGGGASLLSNVSQVSRLPHVGANYWPHYLTIPSLQIHVQSEEETSENVNGHRSNALLFDFITYLPVGLVIKALIYDKDVQS